MRFDACLVFISPIPRSHLHTSKDPLRSFSNTILLVVSYVALKTWMSQYYISPTNNKRLYLLDVVFVKSGMIKVSLWSRIKQKLKLLALKKIMTNTLSLRAQRSDICQLSASTPDNSRFTWTRVSKVCQQYKSYRDVSDLRLSKRFSTFSSKHDRFNVYP